MAQKYELIYLDVVNVEHELQIYDDSYSGDVIEIQGKIFLDYSKADDNLEAIRGQGLRVELEANSDLTYSDLYSEEEKTFPVTYLRDSVILFDGWLNPEGFYENFVMNKWYVTFDCIDGLGYLENLSFVNTDGSFITGKISQFEAIRKALLRTGLEKDINVSIDIYYTGLSTDVCILENVFVIAERYIKDDGNTIMSCEEVLRDILEPYGAVLVSYADAWYIYKPNELYKSDNKILSFYNFDFEGTPGSAFTQRFLQPLGSQVNDYYPHHCSENQSLGIAPSTGAYRISYKYGKVKSFSTNIFLFSADGNTIDEWTILDDTNMEALVAGEYGVTFNNVTTGNEVENLRSDPVTVTTDIEIDVFLKYKIPRLRGTVVLQYEIYYSDTVLPDGGADIYWLQADETWGAVGVQYTWENTDTQFTTIIEHTVPTKPIGGTMYFYISIYSPVEGPTASHDTELVEVRTSPSNEASGSSQNDVIGEFHTFQRTTQPSAQIQTIKQVATGDNEPDLYVGTIYENDETTPTETWFRAAFPSEEKPILQIMGEELMRMQQLPSRLFSGDVYGYISYLNVISINGISTNDIPNQFMILEYSYNTYANIISMVMRQIFGDELSDQEDDGFYEQTTDYGETVKPTIIN